MSRIHKQGARLLAGRRVLHVFTDANEYGEESLYLMLDDGATVYVMQDTEGNGPGTLHHYAADKGHTLTLLGGR